MNHLSDVALEFEALPVETVVLEDSQLERAKQLTRAIAQDSRQWQAYLNALAAFAFEQWLQEWAADLSVNWERCSIFQPPYAEVLGASCQLKIGEFQLCVIPMGSLTEEEIAVPRAAIALPNFAAHFYVVIEVFEEAKRAIARGFLRRDRLMARLAETRLTADPDWTYSIPLSWLERNPEDLFLYLRCLDPRTIPLPAVSPQPFLPLSALQTQLSAARSRLHASELELWEVFNWEQGTLLFERPEVLQWLLDPTGAIATPFSVGFTNPKSKPIPNLKLNVASWLRDELDELARQMSWVLLPAFSLEASALRSPTQELQGLIDQLERDGRSIPTVARSAYLDLNLAQTPLKLYAIAWPLRSPDNRPAWTLLLILGVPSGMGSMGSIKLAIADRTSLLLERSLEADAGETYLYAQVGGTMDEEFSVTLSAAEGMSLTLPPFVFLH